MIRIHVMGAAGSGTSTIGRLISHELGIPFLETDSFYWLETDPPFQLARSIPKRNGLLKWSLNQMESFVLSGSIADFSLSILCFIDVIIYLSVPTDIRLKRIVDRDETKYGSRISDGGDMYERHRRFLKFAAEYEVPTNISRSKSIHEQIILASKKPLIRVNGDKGIADTISEIICKIYELVHSEV